MAPQSLRDFIVLRILSKNCATASGDVLPVWLSLCTRTPGESYACRISVF